jgi:phosphatidylglycerophosphate synthase
MKKIVAYIPNALTLLRLIIACAIGTLLFIEHALVVVQVLAVVGIITDKLDGTLARLWNVESELGKKLESVVDPLFNLLAGTYIITQLDFPMIYFWIGLAMLGITVVARIIVKITTGKFFYEKSPITRFGTAFAFLVIIVYLFSVPYRDLVIAAGCVYGVVVTLNYLHMIVRFIQREQGSA